MKNEVQVVTSKEVESLVIELRGQKVLLDRDVAALYGVETKRVNEAVRNNPDKFPERYCFTLQVSEKQHVVENFDRMQNLKKSPVSPRAFTEGGVYLLATILKSSRATQTTMAIIDAFVKLREFSRCVAAMGHEPDVDKQKLNVNDNNKRSCSFLGSSFYLSVSTRRIPDVGIRNECSYIF